MALKKGDKFVLELGEERTETHECDCISRQAAIALADTLKDDVTDDDRIADAVMAHNEGILEYQTALSLLPSAQQDCTECKDYDNETKSCPKYCRVIRQTLAEAQPEIDEILDYLDTELHPLVSPEHWDVYATLHDMISLLHLKQPQQTGRCKDCLMRDVCRFEQFLGLNGFCSQWQKMEGEDETD